MSSAIIAISPTKVFTVNLYSCDQKYRDWITATTPDATLVYDLRNPPTSALEETYSYSGPPITACGNPTFTLADDKGVSISFMSVSFDSISGEITISLPETTTPARGTYPLYLVFTQPGSFSFPIGLSLQVKDVCDDSTFPAAPALSLDN